MDGQDARKAALTWLEMEAEFNDRQVAGKPCDLIVRMMLALRPPNGGDK